MRRLLAVVAVLALAGCHDHPIPTPSPSASPSASPTVTQPVAGWPTPETTGAPKEIGLPSGPCSLAAGATYDGYTFACSTLEARAGTVIRNSVVRGEVKGVGFTIEDSTVASGGACDGRAAIGWGQFTARRVELVGWGDAFRVEDGQGQVLIEDSYMKLCETASTHGDGLQGYRAGSDVTMRHNTVDQPSGVVLDGVTANVFWADGSGDRLRLEGNLFIGGGYTIRIHSGSGHVVKGNRVTGWRWGPVDCAGASIATWSDNRAVTLDGYAPTSVGTEVRC